MLCVMGTCTSGAVLRPDRRPLSALALVRIVSGFSQQELADEAGLSRRTIFNLEHGRHTPRDSTAAAISEVFGLDDPRRLFPLNDEGPAGNGASVKERDDGAHHEP